MPKSFSLMGSIAELSVIITDLEKLTKMQKPIYGATIGGDSIYSTKLPNKASYILVVNLMNIKTII